MRADCWLCSPGSPCHVHEKEVDTLPEVRSPATPLEPLEPDADALELVAVSSLVNFGKNDGAECVDQGRGTCVNPL
jgi:hypothetical protein